MGKPGRKTWPGNDIPIFGNSKENLQTLQDLVKRLVPECGMEIFGEKAIGRYIIDTLTERRRNVKKGYDYGKVK